jgi:hypothetical protein
MEENSTTAGTSGTALFAGEAWFDPIEAGIRDRVRGFIEELLEDELAQALGRSRHERAAAEPNGYRNGTRERRLLGSFGPVEISVPRARMRAASGGTQEWRSAALPRYARMTRQVEALIASAYLSGTNTRRVKRALAALFTGAVGKDVVSRTLRRLRRRLLCSRIAEEAMAQGADGLGGLEQARPGRRRHRAPDPGRHGRAGPAGSQGDLDLAAGRARRAA